MYYDHFRLSGEPFSLTPDPAFLFLSEKHREAMAAVQYGLENGRGFITLIGEVGTGKTTILYSVLSQLGPDVAAAYVPYAAHTFDDLLTAALKDLGEKPPAGASRLDLLEILQQMLVDAQYHADPHPGNVMVLRDGRLALIDFGAASRIDPLQQTAIRDVIRHVEDAAPARLHDGERIVRPVGRKVADLGGLLALAGQQDEAA